MSNDLTEKIARAIHEDQSNTPWEDRLSGDDQDLRQMAAAVLPLVAAEVRKAKAEAWDEGHRTPWVREPDECECGAWSSNECGCGLYGTGRIVTPNPYPEETKR